MRYSAIFIILFCLLPSAHAKRYALVIGNSNYSDGVGKLKNPINDASDMAAMLRKKQFTVNLLKNATKRQMKESINAFNRQLREKGAVGLFFFAGHGVEVDGRNYLIPIGAIIQGEGEVEYESIDAGRVMSGMKIAGNNLNIVILDACRNNPFSRSFRSANRGLKRMSPPKGALILYATSPGEIAADGLGRNGLFTQYLLKAIDTPNLTVEQVFKTTANNVYQATGKKQLPWQAGVMLGDFYFTGGEPSQEESVFWNIVSQKNTPAYYQAYINKYGVGGLYYQLALLGLNRPSKASAPEPPPSSPQLTIKTNPAGALVRILNIVPKYKNGIELKPGRYHIEVSSPGYQRHTEWLTLGTENKVHNVILTALAYLPAASYQPMPSGHNTTASEKKRKDRQNIDMVWVKPGCFQMGSNSVSGDEKPVHQVCLSKGYYMGKYDVTQAQWQSVMGNNPSNFKCQQCPVEQVSWDSVQDFIQRLNRQSRLQYRLPTEAEWEYACRSGGREQMYCGGNSIESIAWYSGNSNKKTHTVGQKQANELGLYDMSGNVWEWVSDWYSSDYYHKSPVRNPKGPYGGSTRVFRGGSWRLKANGARSAFRRHYSPDGYARVLGFRLARTY